MGEKVHRTDNACTGRFPRFPERLCEEPKTLRMLPGMASNKLVTCPSCGFDKNPEGSQRCGSCGAKIESLEGSARSKEDEADRRYQQDGLSVQWTLIALAVQALLTGAVVFGLPWLIRAIDFEGGNGMIVCIPVWFVGGLLVGMISPGRTFIEPMIAAFLVAIPSTYLLHASQTVRTLPAFLYVILGGIGVLFTLIGSYLGERWQLVTPKKA
jgi:hypothetical protein